MISAGRAADWAAAASPRACTDAGRDLLLRDADLTRQSTSAVMPQGDVAARFSTISEATTVILTKVRREQPGYPGLLVRAGSGRLILRDRMTDDRHIPVQASGRHCPGGAPLAAAESGSWRCAVHGAARRISTRFDRGTDRLRVERLRMVLSSGAAAPERRISASVSAASADHPHSPWTTNGRSKPGEAADVGIRLATPLRSTSAFRDGGDAADREFHRGTIDAHVVDGCIAVGNPRE